MTSAAQPAPRSRSWLRGGSTASDAVLVGLLCLAVAGLADAVMRHETGATGDEPFYIRMATHPAGPHSFPYAYRVAVPWLVHVLPFSELVSFQLQALLGIAACGAVMYVLLREFDTRRWLGIALALGLTISPNLLVVLLRHGRSIDPAVTLVMILGSLFIVRRNRLALAVTILIGAAVKETSLFLIPFAYAVWARAPLDREALRDTVLVRGRPNRGLRRASPLHHLSRKPVHPRLRGTVPDHPPPCASPGVHGRRAQTAGLRLRPAVARRALRAQGPLICPARVGPGGALRGGDDRLL